MTYKPVSVRKLAVIMVVSTVCIGALVIRTDPWLAIFNTMGGMVLGHFITFRSDTSPPKPPTS